MLLILKNLVLTGNQKKPKKLTDSLKIDVTGGEQDCDLRIWRDMVNRKIVNIFQPDVMYLGGLTKALKVAKLYNQRKQKLERKQLRKELKNLVNR